MTSLVQQMASKALLRRIDKLEKTVTAQAHVVRLLAQALRQHIADRHDRTEHARDAATLAAIANAGKPQVKATPI